ncbi:MAG: DUF1616 domain-containing protein [Dehalococcoidia bacterium]|nr:DUF1616 domain-containing protein [Dehalococcoidia bacterium]
MIGKKIRFTNEILFINILVLVLLIIIVLLPSNILRIILGLPFLLFFPGYTLMAALFPKKGELGGLPSPFGREVAPIHRGRLRLSYPDGQG